MDQSQNPGFNKIQNKRSSTVQLSPQNFVPSRELHVLPNSRDMEYPNASPSHIDRFYSLKKYLEAEKKIRRSVEASGRLWTQECKRLKLDLNKEQVEIDCLKHQKLSVSVPSTKPS